MVLLYLETLRYRSLVERVRLYRASRDDHEHFNEQDVMEVIEISQMSNVGVCMWRGMEGWKRLGEGNTRRGKWLGRSLHTRLPLTRSKLTQD